MSQWSSPLKIETPELFSSINRKGFPTIASGEEGIRVYADKLNYQEGLFSCQLLISYAFARQFISSFKRPGQALIVLIENAETGQCHQMNLTDPHKRYPSLDGDNYSVDTAKPHKGSYG